MNESTTYVGMDTHKLVHAVAILLPGSDRPLELTVASGEQQVRKMVRRVLRKAPGEVVFCYEAGVCGFTLARVIKDEGAACMVIAPTLVPVRPGKKIKTDRRDAKNLAELLRAGLLVEVHLPDEATEAVRDMVRCRQAAVADLQRTRQRLGKFLTRRGFIYTAGNAWTQKHLAWVDGLRFVEPADTLTMASYRRELDWRGKRVAELAADIEEIATEEPYAEPVGWLCCFHGIKTLTAMTILTELHEFSRFQSPRQLMSYLGLTPSEHSSGQTERKGGITKAGNRRVRRVLIEAAWQQGRAKTVSKTLTQRRAGQPQWVVNIADRARHRLHRRYHRLTKRGKLSVVANTAVSRELAGFIWAVLCPQARAAREQSESACRT